MGDLLPEFIADNSFQPSLKPYAVLVKFVWLFFPNHILAVNTLFLVVFSAMVFIAAAAISVSVKIGAPFLSAWSPISQAPSLKFKRFWTEKSPEVWTNLSNTFFSK